MKYAASASLAATTLLFSSGVYGMPQGQPGQSAAVTMNTPTNLVTCEPVMLSWNGGTAPYFLSLQDGNNFNGPAISRFEQQKTNSMSWTVTVPAGKSVAFLLRDSSGQMSLTAPVSVQGGSQDSCVDHNISFAPASGSTSAAAPQGSGAAPPPNPAAGATQASPATPTQGSGSSGDSSASDTAAGAQSTSNGASKATSISGVVLPAVAALFGIMFA
ncbi:hypothetical protein V5O48_001058 [Marasmius crinis-equi]|uniref:Uncharacterized protein n=1 Tax=Marasmius crinis-equi TaxID=585013 RepID=A0ABR3FZI0_9AGAR